MLGRVVASEDIGKPPSDDQEQFLAHSRMQLGVGWQAIELYPLLSDDHWRPENAGLWAEMDILAVAAARNLFEQELNALDDRAAARERYATLLAEFAALL